MSGWICLHRGWRDNEVFGGPEVMSEREAWSWLIETAAWKPTVRRSAKGERVEIARGQLHTSLRALGTVFGWGKNKVDRFLSRLAKHSMIGTASDPNGLIVTICNYDKYQDVQPTRGTVTGTVAGQSRDTQEQGITSSASNEAGVPPTDTVKAIWELGITLLVASGQTDRAARSIVGRWRKDHGDARTLEAMLDCQARRISNPVEWMPRRLAAAANQAPAPSDFARRVLEKRRAA